MRPRRALASTIAVACACAACGAGTRDVVPVTHDVQVSAGGGQALQTGYTYIARRPLGFVALAKETGLGTELGARAADHLADALDACATNLAVKGKLVEGTIRIEAAVTVEGNVAISHVTVAPGDGVAANALLCVMAPLKMTTFPGSAGDAGARSFAIDASWGTAQGAPATR
jgi:hypothetical protein